MHKHPTIELLEWLNHSVIYVLESLTCLAVFYLFYHFFLRKEKSFYYNRAFLLGALLLSFSFPILEFDYDPNKLSYVFNSIHEVGNEVSDEPIIEAQRAYSYTITAKSERPFLLWWEALLLIYVIGAITGIIRLLAQMRNIKEAIWYKRHNTRYRNGYFFVPTDGTLPTFSFFNYLFWDNTLDLPENEKAQILAHEKAHIKEGHSYDVIFIEVLKIIFWFNPLLYLYKGLLEESHEYAADRTVAQLNGNKVYSKVLVRVVFQKMGLELASHFNKNQILKRVKMLEMNKKINYLKMLVPLPIAALLFFIFSFDPVIKNNEVKIGRFVVEAQAGSLQLAASPRGGIDAWNDYLESSIIYPEIAKNASISGDVEISFTVNKAGKLEQLYFNKTLGYNTEGAILKALERSTIWNPSIVNGKAVDSRITLPITFEKI